MPQEIAAQVQLTIVGDGPEREHVEKIVAQHALQDKVSFTGWVDQAKTVFYYQQADVFCFPSIREFGGAVALEAMACGLPCIVPDYAGLGEYVTNETGFKIEAKSREYIIAEMASKIKLLFEDEE